MPTFSVPFLSYLYIRSMFARQENTSVTKGQEWAMWAGIPKCLPLACRGQHHKNVEWWRKDWIERGRFLKMKVYWKRSKEWMGLSCSIYHFHRNKIIIIIIISSSSSIHNHSHTSVFSLAQKHQSPIVLQILHNLLIPDRRLLHALYRHFPRGQ